MEMRRKRNFQRRNIGVKRGIIACDEYMIHSKRDSWLMRDQRILILWLKIEE